MAISSGRETCVLKFWHEKAPPVDSALRWSFQTQATQASTPHALQPRQRTRSKRAIALGRAAVPPALGIQCYSNLTEIILLTYRSYPQELIQV